MGKEVNVGIVGVGIYLPEKIMTAAEISAATNGVWSEQAVIDKLGIRQKRLPGDDDGTQEMGARAALDCIEKTGISPYVDAMLARDEVDNPKPSSDHLIKVVEILESTPERVVYIGDSKTDLMTAEAAGITFLGFWWNDERAKRMKEAGCRNFIHDLRDILNYI